MTKTTKHERMAQLHDFSLRFKTGLIGNQPYASKRMCAVVSMPLRAALKVFLGVSTDLVTEDGHTFLVTPEGLRIDPTIDQFSPEKRKVLVEPEAVNHPIDECLNRVPFDVLLQEYKRICQNENKIPTPTEAGNFIAQVVFFPLARQGFFV